MGIDTLIKISIKILLSIPLIFLFSNLITGILLIVKAGLFIPKFILILLGVGALYNFIIVILISILIIYFIQKLDF